MASRETLKSYFQVGDTPSEANFTALIDSLAHVGEDNLANTTAVAVAGGKTLTVSNTLTLTGTDSSTLNVLAGGLLGSRTLVTDATATRTLVLTDAQKYIRFTSGSATVVTIPPQTDVVWLANTEIEFERAGVGSLTIAPGAGVTLRNAKSLTGRAQYSVLRIKRIASDEWVVSGDMT